MNEHLRPTDAKSTLAPLRRMLLLLLLVGTVGLGAELALLGHTESWEQWIPLVLLGAALPVEVGLVARASRPLIHAFRVIMTLAVVAGLVGVYLHFAGNVEWELESDASLRGFALVRLALTGATPTLAPGAMAQLGFLGLIYTFRHPVLSGVHTRKEN